MTTINMHEAKTHLSRYVERALQGEEIIIARAGKAVAKLVPCETERVRREPGGWEGQVWMADDFDELPKDILEAFEGKKP